MRLNWRQLQTHRKQQFWPDSWFWEIWHSWHIRPESIKRLPIFLRQNSLVLSLYWLHKWLWISEWGFMDRRLSRSKIQSGSIITQATIIQCCILLSNVLNNSTDKLFLSQKYIIYWYIWSQYNYKGRTNKRDPISQPHRLAKGGKSID